MIRASSELVQERTKANIDSAILIAEQALELAKSALVPTGTLFAKILHIKSECYLADGDWDRAVSVASGAIELWQKAPGKNQIHVLKGMDILVESGLHKHDLVQCEKASDRRFEILDRLQRPLSDLETEQIVEALNDRGRLRVLQNRHSEALDDFNQGIDLITEGMPEGKSLHAALIGNIGWLFSSQGKYAEAEKYYRRTLELFRDLYGPEHRFIQESYGFLSHVVFLQKRYLDAYALNDTSLSMAKDRYGSSSPKLTANYAMKARVLVALDSVESAIQCSELALELSRMGTDFPTDQLMGQLWTAGNVAFAAGNHDLAMKRFDELVEIRQTFLRSVFSYASEEHRLAYLRRYGPIFYTYISGAVNYPFEELNRGVLNMLLSGKGLSIDALAADQSAATCSEDPGLDALLVRRKEVCAEIARLALSSHSDEADVIQTLRDLYNEKERIELDLSSRCSQLDFGAKATEVSASAVASVMPEQSVLWEFVQYYRTDPGRPHDDNTLRGMSYAALTLDPHDRVGIVDLGRAAGLDSLINEYHDAMANALEAHFTGQGESSIRRYRQIASALYTRLITPLQPTLDGAFQVFVAADGLLNLLPFESLTDDNDRYLIEDHAFVYLTSGRDLLKVRQITDDRSAIVMTNPDFMSDPTAPPVIARKSFPVLAARGSPECLASMFAPVPSTRQEGLAVARILEQDGGLDISFLESGSAQEGALKNLHEAPRVLHIATHGYFCSDTDRDAMSNPLLRSGLILAGANRTIGQLDDNPSYADDGILSALEVSGLDLIGTDLVVLSACHTGVGEVQKGEGVFGLRRAFQHAGARSLLTSMFAVPDLSTSALMERFYENWLAGELKSSALRKAALSLLEECRMNGQPTHPLFWGGFILVGDPN